MPRPLARHVKGTLDGTAAELGANGSIPLTLTTVDPAELPGLSAPLLATVNTIWDEREFARARQPLSLGLVDLTAGAVPRVGDIPLKFPGTDYRVPVELAGLQEVLERAASWEAAVNEHVDDYCAYLTCERGLVSAGQLQRGGGAHSDSVQGRRVQPKTVIEHGYVCASSAPTGFYVQAFDLGAATADTHWLNAIFEEQKEPAALWRPAAGELVMFDAYSVHEAQPATETGERTFLRLLYSVRRFDRAGNTRNVLFDYDWAMQPRPLPEGLIGR